MTILLAMICGATISAGVTCLLYRYDLATEQKPEERVIPGRFRR